METPLRIGSLLKHKQSGDAYLVKAISGVGSYQVERQDPMRTRYWYQVSQIPEYFEIIPDPPPWLKTGAKIIDQSNNLFVVNAVLGRRVVLRRSAGRDGLGELVETTLDDVVKDCRPVDFRPTRFDRI
jgi:hypothetical protein